MKLKKIYSAKFPPKGFKALTVCPFVFVRSDQKKNFRKADDRHEATHALQQIECIWIFFFIIYGLEYIIKLPCCKFDTDRAYMSISFEQEAYEHQAEVGYNNVRKHYVFFKYLFTLTPKK